MPYLRNSFDPRKAVELILYVADRLPVGKATFHRISKVIYFSDLCHLDRYGRLISDDSYVAMKHGPVPSSIYDIMKRNSLRDFDKFSEGAFDIANDYEVHPVRKPLLEFLSESETECLDETIEKYGAMGFGQLKTKSHKGAWDKADENDTIKLEDMIDMLPSKDELKQHVFGR